MNQSQLTLFKLAAEIFLYDLRVVTTPDSTTIKAFKHHPTYPDFYYGWLEQLFLNRYTLILARHLPRLSGL
jgi:hypothetical protein